MSKQLRLPFTIADKVYNHFLSGGGNISLQRVASSRTQDYHYNKRMQKTERELFQFFFISRAKEQQHA